MDAFRGTLSARRVFMLARRLMDEPMSRLRAELMGAEWLGYSLERHELRDLYNAIGTHIQVSAGKKRPSQKHFKHAPATKPRMASTNIADFPIEKLAAQLNR